MLLTVLSLLQCIVGCKIPCTYLNVKCVFECVFLLGLSKNRYSDSLRSDTNSIALDWTTDTNSALLATGRHTAPSPHQQLNTLTSVDVHNTELTAVANIKLTPHSKYCCRNNIRFVHQGWRLCFLFSPSPQQPVDKYIVKCAQPTPQPLTNAAASPLVSPKGLLGSTLYWRQKNLESRNICAILRQTLLIKGNRSKSPEGPSYLNFHSELSAPLSLQLKH